MDFEALPVIEDYADVSFNPFTAAKELGGEGQVKDFHPELARLRSINPVFDGELKVHFGLAPDLTLNHMRHVALLAYPDVRRALTDTETFSTAAYHTSLGVYFGRSVTTMDDPEHAHYRRLFQQAFGPRMIARWGEEIIPRMINRLIDGFESRGEADLVGEFT